MRMFSSKLRIDPGPLMTAPEAVARTPVVLSVPSLVILWPLRSSFTPTAPIAIPSSGQFRRSFLSFLSAVMMSPH